MSPDELIQQLAARGAKVSRRTLQEWTRAGLLPEPVRGSHGRGRGRFTDYPPEATAQALAAWWLLSGRTRFGRMTLGAVAEGRRVGLEMEEHFRTDPSLARVPRVAAPHPWVAWLVAYLKAVHGWPLEKPAKVHYEWHDVTRAPDGTWLPGRVELRFEAVPPEKEGISVTLCREDERG